MQKRLSIVCITAAAVFVATAQAQATYTESFQNVGSGESGPGGPSALAQRGWVFRNQSRPSGTGVNAYWSEFPGWGHVESCLGHGGFATWQNSSSKISAWAILPAIPNQHAGDPLELWTSAPTNAFGENSASLEIRYSASGATSTGSSENDVGNFNTLLLSISGAGGHPWTKRTIVLPGTGRVALRLVMGPGATSNAFSGSMLVDSLRVGTPPPPPYPLPVAGQTVHWTAAQSPVLLNVDGTGQSPRIVPGATVIVDDGVELRLGASTHLDISGNLVLQGAAGSPIRLRGSGQMTVAKGGLLTATFADVETFTDLIYGGRAAFTDSAFRDPSQPTGFSYDGAGDIGHRFFDGNLAYDRQVLSLTRCTFAAGCDVALLRGWLAARDCTFTNGGVVTTNPGPGGGEAIYVSGNSILQNVTVDGGYIDLIHDKSQHRYIGDISVTGNPYGPGLRLEGGASYLIDETATLQDNVWPVSFGLNSAGILPGSRLPQTGNQLNEIPDTDDSAPLDEHVVWADAGIPYIVPNWGTLHGQVTILPGVTVKLLPDAVFFFDTDSNGAAMPVFLGDPDRPIKFEPYFPGQPWYSIVAGNTRWFGTRWDWCEFSGGRFGVGSAELPLSLDNCLFHDNFRSFYSEEPASFRKCTFINNTFSYTGERFAPNHEVRGRVNADHPTNPNSFINNAGVASSEPNFGLSFLPNGGLIASFQSDLGNNWWGTPTGPRDPNFNPLGEGDAVFTEGANIATPFLSEPPTANTPPTVRFVTQPLPAVVPEEIIHFQWTARDDGTIVTQRVYFSPSSNIDDGMQFIAEIPGSARSFEWAVPHVGFSPARTNEYIRIVAVDELGQEGLADLPLAVTSPEQTTGEITVNPPPAPVLHPGDAPQSCGTVTGLLSPIYIALEFDNDDTGVSLGGGFTSGGAVCTALPRTQIPDLSTDRARLRFDSVGSLNQVKSFYGAYFAIRPDPLLGDAAPTVHVTAPVDGSEFTGGGMVPISWTAADDEALRSFDIRASFDGGTRWFIIARDLPADARSYQWRLPESAGISDVRVRVVAKDRRFQNSSSETGAFAILPGTWRTPLRGDMNCDGRLDNFDIDPFVLAIVAPELYAATYPGCDIRHGDANADGRFDNFDIDPFVNCLVSGCP